MQYFYIQKRDSRFFQRISEKSRFERLIEVYVQDDTRIVKGVIIAY